MSARMVLLGPPGAGKGTQAARIAERLGIPAISTGDIFRSEIGKGSDLGKLAKSYIDAGKLVPDEVVADMVAAKLLSVMIYAFPADFGAKVIHL